MRRIRSLHVAETPPPFMANAILNFHFDFLTPSLILAANQFFVGWLLVKYAQNSQYDFLQIHHPAADSDFYKSDFEQWRQRDQGGRFHIIQFISKALLKCFKWAGQPNLKSLL